MAFNHNSVKCLFLSLISNLFLFAAASLYLAHCQNFCDCKQSKLYDNYILKRVFWLILWKRNCCNHVTSPFECDTPCRKMRHYRLKMCWESNTLYQQTEPKKITNDRTRFSNMYMSQFLFQFVLVCLCAKTQICRLVSPQREWTKRKKTIFPIFPLSEQLMNTISIIKSTICTQIMTKRSL